MSTGYIVGLQRAQLCKVLPSSETDSWHATHSALVRKLVQLPSEQRSLEDNAAYFQTYQGLPLGQSRSMRLEGKFSRLSGETGQDSAIVSIRIKTLVPELKASAV